MGGRLLRLRHLAWRVWRCAAAYGVALGDMDDAYQILANVWQYPLASQHSVGA